MAEAVARGVSIIAAAPYNSGALGPRDAPGSTYNYAPMDSATRCRVEGIYSICASEGVDVGAAALQFPLAHPAVCCVVSGFRSAFEVDSAVLRISADISAPTWNRLRETGHIEEHAPVPV